MRVFVNSAKEAIEAGASRTTAWRAAKRGWFEKDYHVKSEREPIIDFQIEDIYKICANGVRKVFGAELSRKAQFWLPDIVSEAVTNYLAHGSKITHSGVLAAWFWGKRSAFDWMRSHAWEKEVYNVFPEKHPEPFCEEYPFFDAESAQMILDRTEMGSDLYRAFRSMRKAQNPHCENCGNDENWTLHHIIPRRVKKENTRENTAALCRRCHNEIEFVYGILEAGDHRRKMDYPRLFKSWKKQGVELTIKENLAC